MSDIQFPVKLQCLFEDWWRNIVLYGGRGGAKSWGIARAALIKGAARPFRVLCAREQQNSIAESVHKLLSDQILALGMTDIYQIQRDRIIGPNGTSFAFEGIRTNTDRIRSYEGVDLCWVEEANSVSEESWSILTPTIRKAGSQIWISFNPKLKSDYTYRNFVLKPPADTKVVFMSWRDNPWFPEVLRKEMEDLKVRDYDSYLHVWEGQCVTLLDGAVYAEELRQARKERRIGKVPLVPGIPVEVFFDLGWSDHTSMWFRQRVGFEWHYVDYYENRQKSFDHYLKVMQERGYLYSTIWLPHDAKAKELGTGMSIWDRLRRTHKTRIVRKLSLVDGIDAGRTIFPSCWFDEQLCDAGLDALTNYRYEVQDSSVGSLSRTPVHDWSSHGADGFRYSAVASKMPKQERLGVDESENLGILVPRKGRIIELDLDAGSSRGTSTAWMG